MKKENWLMATQIEGDYRVTRIMAGDASLVRGRLAEAVERLGYQVISDQTALVARRGARGGASSGCSWNIRDYPTELTATFKQSGTNTTLVTFNFAVRNYYYGTRGDRQTLEREADALAALAVSATSSGLCVACGTEASDDSRFCRRCGVPLAAAEPAEVEVLRLSARANAAQKGVLSGALIVLFVVVMAIIILGRETPKAIHAAQVLLVMGGLSGLMMLLFSLRGLNPRRSKKDEDETEEALAAASRAAIFAPRSTTALPPRSPSLSVTDGTTELLDDARREPVAVEARRAKRETGE
jgi:hypothetical protein